jgi:hypothetical protein
MRSNYNFVVSSLSINTWLAHPPSAEEARPSHCPACGDASRPTGRHLVLHGHGQRERQLRGPPSPDAAPAVLLVKLRRYVCVACGAVITVAPRLVARGRLYSAAAIGMALALWGSAKLCAREVRRRVSPHRYLGANAAQGWAALSRWAGAVAAGTLLTGIRASPEEWPWRKVAERVAQTLASLGPLSSSEEPFLVRVFAGAEHARLRTSRPDSQGEPT